MQPELKPNNRRTEAFSDGVFAIVVTIMVFDIHIPDSLAAGMDPAALAEFGLAITAYAMSFLVIVNLWISHHYLLFTLTMPARSTLWFNNLLLFCVTLIPLSTRFLGMHPMSPRAAAAYGFVAGSCTISFMLLRAHASRITRNEAHREIHRIVLRRTSVFLAIYAASIPLAFVSPWLAWTCFVVVMPPMLLLPIRTRAAAEAIPMEHRTLERSCP